MKLENKTDKQLKKDAWKYISIIVRSENADFAGYTRCYTCKEVKLWKEMDCGHFIHDKGDFLKDNLKPQCSRCNRFLHGNLGVYAERLIEDNGLEWVKDLRQRVEKRGNRWTRDELIRIIEYYK